MDVDDPKVDREDQGHRSKVKVLLLVPIYTSMFNLQRVPYLLKRPLTKAGGLTENIKLH